MDKPAKLTMSDNVRATHVIEEYRDFFTLRMRPVSEAFIERLASDLLEWAINDDNALKLAQFSFIKGMHHRNLHRWSDKYPILKFAKEIALEAIGNRREIGALKNKLNASMIMSQMSKYDESWMKLETKRAELRARTGADIAKDVKYTIVLDSYKDKDKAKTDNLPKE